VVLLFDHAAPENIPDEPDPDNAGGGRDFKFGISNLKLKKQATFLHGRFFYFMDPFLHLTFNF
jgi:hypothetical protein